jgi:methyl-accepting chemotaxis protein
MEFLQLAASGATTSAPRLGWLRRASPDGGMTVKASLWLAFGGILLGALVIGAFSLWQMGRINASTQAIYEQEYAAGQAAEQVRGLVLRASRAQTQLLTATTASEREALGKDIDSSVAEIDARLTLVTRLSEGDEAKAGAARLGESMAKWSKRLRDYVVLVKAQPLDLVQMSADVPTEDAGLLNETLARKERGCRGAVAQRIRPGHHAAGLRHLHHLHQLGGRHHAGLDCPLHWYQPGGDAASGAPARW